MSSCGGLCAQPAMPPSTHNNVPITAFFMAVSPSSIALLELMHLVECALRCRALLLGARHCQRQLGVGLRSLQHALRARVLALLHQKLRVLGLLFGELQMERGLRH